MTDLYGNEEDHPRPRPAGTLHALVARSIAARRAAVAIADRGRNVTYGALDVAATRVGARLAALGVGRDRLVGVLLPRSAAQVVAALGTLRAGGAYLPLDPRHPPERVRFIVSDAKPAVIVTDSAHVGLLGAADVPVLLVDADGAPLQDGPTIDDMQAVGRPDDLAYVIYTSGSTGRPKGVEVTHGNVTSLLEACQPLFGFGPDDSWTYFHSFAFDVSVFEIWGALASGGRLVVVPSEMTRRPAAFARLLAEERVTILSQTPSAFRGLMHADERAAGTLAVRLVLFAGERLDPGMLRSWVERRGDSAPRLVNMYGITETTVHVTLRDIVAKDVLAGGGSPIGVALPHLKLRLVDADGSEVADGEVGELRVSGAGVARGYLGRPELTAERFVSGPDGVREYRSGDLGRRLASGEVEYVGRADSQVKIRGHRVELGEIEAVLREHDAVRDAVVVLHRSDDDSARLAAYVVGESQQSPAELREHLSARLPSYMVPAAYIRIDRLPLTVNDKLDRAALPPPGERAFLGLGSAIPHEGEIEAAVAAAFAAASGISLVGRSDEFFRLGGDSLGAVQAALALSVRLDVDAQPADIFEHPRVADLARVLATRAGGRHAPVDVPPRVSAPLTPSQRALWIDHLLNPDVGVYTEHVVAELCGPIDEDRLAFAVRAVVRAHPALRLRIHGSDGRFEQVIAPPDDDAVFDVVLDANLEASIRAAVGRPIDAAAASPFRATLIRADRERAVLVLAADHVVVDERSLTLVMRDISRYYACSESVLPDPDPRAAQCYLAHATSLADAAAGPPGQTDAAYWQDALAGAELAHGLLSEVRLPRPGDSAGAEIELPLPTGLAERLESLARDLGTTRFTVELAVFLAVVGRFSGREDIVVGTAMDSRLGRDTTELAGLLLDVVPLRGAVPPGKTLADVVAGVAESLLAARRHTAVASGGLTADRTGRYPVQLLVTPRMDPVAELRIDGVHAIRRHVPRTTARIDVAAFLARRADGDAVRIEYRTGVLDEYSAERLARHFVHALDVFAEHPRDAIGSLDLLPADESRRIDGWNETAAPYPRDDDLCGRFREMVAAHANSIAVEEGARRLTYAELDAESDSVAAALCSAGVGAGGYVGVCLPRSTEYVVSILGVLKTGSAYVPLDPALPEARLRDLLSDLGRPVVIASEATRDRVPTDAAEGVLVAPRAPGAPAPVPVDALRCANVLFTSGSTGRPKGVRLPHRGVMRLVVGSDFARTTSSDVWLAAATPSFDASTLEIWSPLLNGGRLVVLKDGLPTPVRLREAIRASAVTSLVLTTSLFNAIIDESPDAISGLRQCFVAGEAISRPHAARAARRYVTTTFVNGYGPTENSVATCRRILEPEDLADGAIVPIGTPISNTTVHILGPDLRPVPIGAPGELCAGGDGLALDYLARPDETALRFVDDPCAPGRRLYRTGDRARWRPDGQIEFLGRLDDQVKLRGFRIELGEVASALQELPGVGTAAVVVRGDGANRHLAAYVVPSGAIGTESELTDRLHGVLPGYMVPASITLLDRLPLRASGKLDERALPEPDVDDGTQPDDSERPAHPWQESVLTTMRDVLGRPHAGADDDFFDQGGQSLMAMIVAARLSQLLDVRVEVRDVFEQRTPRALSAALAARAPAATIPHVPRDRPLLLSPAQEAVWLHEAFHPDDASYAMPLAWRLAGELDLAALSAALQDLVDRHESLRTAFLETADGPRQVVRESASLDLTAESRPGLLDDARTDSVRDAAETLAGIAFELGQPPLVRAHAVRFADDDHGLALVFHHLVIDGWSVGVLARDLGRAYEARVSGAVLEPAAVGPSAVDLAVHRRRLVEHGDLESSERHWRGVLQDLEPVRLPPDRPAPTPGEPAGSWCRHTAHPAAAGAVLSAARRWGVTPHVVVLAAFAAAYARFSGGLDVAIGAPVADRAEPGIESVAGFLVATVLLRLDLSDGPDFETLVHRTDAVVRAAIEHRRYPMARVAADLRRTGALAYGPTHHAFFNWVDLDVRSPQLRGVRATPVECSPAGSKFDLTLYASCAAGGLQLVMNYDAARFDAATIEDFVRATELILTRALCEPERPVSTISSWSDARPFEDRAEPVSEAFVPSATLHDAIFEIARAAPDAPAVREPEGNSSYLWLAARASETARAVLASGVEGNIGLLFPHRAESVVAMLGVLASGNAYVPLDPASPAHRLRAACAAADVRAIVAATEHAALAQFVASDDIVVVDLAAASPEGALPTVDPDAPAYVLTTSGTTGEPKCVVQTHRGVLRQMSAFAASIDLAPADRLTLFARYGYDAAVMDIFGALLGGACVLPIDVRQSDAGGIWRWLRDAGATVLHATPTVYRWVLAGSTSPAELPEVRAVVLGGEAALRSDFEAFRQRFREDCVLVNGLGPTESSLGLQHHMTRGATLTRDRISVGRPVPGSSVLLHDEAGRPTDRVGELILVSDRLASGYLGRPDLTAERFATTPDGLRSYRTGDIVRRLPDGTYEALHRRDGQVKVRGVRIELGDVEQALRAHPDVALAVVVAVGQLNAQAGSRMHAHIVPRQDAELEADDIWRFLRERLPAEMLPTQLHRAIRIPKLPNGKPDRRALAGAAGEVLRGQRVSPRNDVERRVLQIWQELLGIDDIGVENDFFHVGGNSLLTVEMLSRVEGDLGVRIPVAAIVESPTVARIAARITGDSWPRRHRAPELVPLRRSGRGSPVFCLPGVGGHVLSYRDLVRQLVHPNPVWGLQVQELDRGDGALDSIESIASTLLESVRLVQPSGPYHLVGYSFGGMIAWEMARQLTRAGDRVALLGLIDTFLPGFAHPAPVHVKAVKHVRELLARSPAGAYRYLAEKLRQRTRRTWAALQHGDAAAGAEGLTAEMRFERVRHLCRKAYSRYEARPYEGRMWLMRATRLTGWIVVDPDARAGGWESLAPGRVTEIPIECDHANLFRAPHLADLAAAVDRALDESGADRPSPQ